MHDENQPLDKATFEVIRRLEESLWRAETRFDNALMEEVFAPDFFEFGRSGQTYPRSAMFFEEGTKAEIAAALPLPRFQARHLADDVIQTTYVSEVSREGQTIRANRSSIWSRMDGRWQLRFHQGTALP
ncbi:MAG: DUF4440 domain-containing protein [Pseudomonadota bacterium]